MSDLLRIDLLDPGAIEFPVRPRRYKNLGAIRKEFRSAALVGFNMRGLMAYHTVIAAAHGSQGERVRGRSIKDKIDVTIDFEDFANHVGRACGVSIFTIGGTTTFAHLEKRCQRFRAEPGGIVAGKIITQVHSGGILSISLERVKPMAAPVGLFNPQRLLPRMAGCSLIWTATS